MRSSTIIAAAFAAMAAAKPIMIKRDYVTEIAVVTVIQTVYADGPAPTAEPEITFAEEQKQLAPVTTVEAAPAPTIEAAPIENEKPVEEEVVEATSEKAPEPVVTPDPEPEPVTSEAAPAPSSAQPEAPATPSAPGQDASFIDIILYNHNIHRANHSAPALTYDADLAASAQALVQNCTMKHNLDLGPATNYGQNLAAAGPTIDVGKSVSGGWYTGEAPSFDNLYGENNPSMDDFHAWGHFSAMVWKGTEKVGCAVNTACRTSDLGMELLACNYKPAGNVGGQYAANILRPLGASTYTG